MPYDRQIPVAPISPSMLPRVAAADLTSQDVFILTQPGNNPGEKNKGLELGVLFEAVKSSLPKDTLVVDEQDEYPSRYLIRKFKGNSASSYLDNGDVGFCVVSRKGVRSIAGVIENKAVTTDKLANDAVTSPKIATEGVSSGNLAKNSVSTEKIADGNVTTTKIADDAVTPEKIDGRLYGQVDYRHRLGGRAEREGERDDGQHRPKDGGTAHKCDRKPVYCRERLADRGARGGIGEIHHHGKALLFEAVPERQRNALRPGIALLRRYGLLIRRRPFPLLRRGTVRRACDVRERDREQPNVPFQRRSERQDRLLHAQGRTRR